MPQETPKLNPKKATLLRKQAEELLHSSPSETPSLPTEEVQALVHELNVYQMELEIQNEELREAQVALAHTRDRYADLYEFAPVGYVTLDRDSRILEANLSAATIFGVERRDLLRAPLSKFASDRSRDDFQRHLRAAFSVEEKQTCEVEMRRADGAPLFVRLESIGVDSDGDRHCRTAIIDVTTVQEMRQRLADSEQRYRRLTETVIDYVFTVRLEKGRVVETIHGLNCEAVTGYTPEEFEANPMLWISIVPEDDRPLIENHIQCMIRGEGVPPVEHRIQRKDGTTIWVLRAVSTYRDSKGRLIGYDGLLRDITDRKEAELALRKLNLSLDRSLTSRSEELYESIELINLFREAIAHLGEGICITGDHEDWPEPRIVFANEAMCQITGYKNEELVGQSPRILEGDDSDRETLDRIEAALSADRPVIEELTCYRKDGTSYEAELFVTPLFDDEGRRVNFVAIHRDISERKRVENEIRRQIQIYERVHDNVIATDMQAKVTLWNKAAETTFGYTAEEAIGRHLKFLYFDDDVSLLESRIIPSLLKEGHYEIEMRSRKKNGEGVWVDRRLTLLRDESGEPVGMVGCSNDITRQKQAEEALRHEHEFTESLVNMAQNIVLVLDPECRIVRVNPYFEELTGFPFDELRGRNWLETCVPEENRPEIGQVFGQAISGRRTRAKITPVLTKEGQEILVEWYDAPLTNANGELVGLLCTGQDVSERVRAELALAEREERLRAILDTASDTILNINRLGIIVDANPAAEQMFGYGKDELVGQKASVLMPQLFRDELVKEYAHYMKNGQANIIGANREVVGMRKDGSTFPVGLAVNEIEHLGLFTAIIRDISRSKELEQEITRVSEMEKRELGHDLHDSVCQELGGLSYMVEGLATELEAIAPQIADRANSISVHIGDAMDSVRQLSHSLDPLMDEPDSLTNALSHLSLTSKEVFRIDCRFKSYGTIEPSSRELALNLYRIAQEAVRNAFRHGQATQVDLTLREQDGHLVLKIQDNGSGLPQDDFKGQGMGIRIMHYRVASLGGWITLENHRAGGVEITCSVPNSKSEGKEL